ncbi:hypothetical protein [Streptomyces flavofungini]|uniref:hypothetical protein n=1 Tax=Streptomyces flavofungini TaxID=68200 RepID=UPI001E5A1011|nr:hypothetical protein [Streptomyces flavofungini]
MRTGPRHAAPKKPLLTRLHVPAGKAIALAAMPTAVLMGMGLTPQLAQAKPGVPKNPFRDGPCVTAPDEQSKEAEKDEQDARAKAAKKAEDKAEAARKKADEAEDKADGEDGQAGKGADKDGDVSANGSSGSSKPSGGDGDDGKSGSTPSGDADADSGKGSGDGGKDDEDAAAEPDPAEPKNPLDPLGLGDALKDILTPEEKRAEEKKEAERESADEKSSDSSDRDAEGTDGDAKDSDGTDKDTKPVEDTLDKAKDGLKDTAGKAEDRLRDAADKADDLADKAEKAADKAKDKAEGKAEDDDEAKDPMAADEDGKKPFPCVVEKKVDGDDEQSPAPIPNQPWHLEASSLLLKGADYKGVVNLKMPNGQTKQALKYIISGGTDIGDLHQIVESPNGKKYHVQAAKGSTSTIRKGDTTMYTERISGNLFGLIPITFDPEHPPPLNLPLIYFTNVKVQQAGQFGGELTIPGLHQSITD